MYSIFHPVTDIYPDSTEVWQCLKGCSFSEIYPVAAVSPVPSVLHINYDVVSHSDSSSAYQWKYNYHYLLLQHIILNKVCFQPDGMLEDKYVPAGYTVLDFFISCFISFHLILLQHRDNETNSWMPLYLASDVLAFESIGNCNKSRIHASFAKQGLATKITLPTGNISESSAVSCTVR